MTSTPDPSPWQDYQAADSAVLDEIIRQGEARLQAQLTSAIAADTRAGLLASIQGAASVALFVAGAQDEIRGAGEIASYVSGTFLALGTLFSILAMRPVAFGFPGNNPSNWIDGIKSKEKLAIAKAGTAALVDKYLRLNERQMASAARFTLASVIFLVISPLAAGAIVLGDLAVRVLCRG